MDNEEKDLRNAVKNARSAFYTFKGKKKKLTRKEARRAERISKKSKIRQHQMKLGKQNTDIPVDDSSRQTQIKKKRKRKKKKKKMDADAESESFDKAAYEAANEADEKLISSLGKKLSGNKKKNHLPSIFKEDGLDYILEVCEPFTTDSKGYHSSDEEYLASKSKKKKKIENKVGSDEMSTKEISNKLLFEDSVGYEDVDEEEEEEFAEESDVDVNNEEHSEEDEDDLESETADDHSDGGNCVVDGLEEKEESDEEDMDEDSKNDTENNEENTLSNKYVPPALRHKNSDNVDKQKLNETRIRKKLKGLLNRVSDGTIPAIITEIEGMYFNNSRNFMNEVLYEMVSESCVSTISTPEKLVLQNMVIIAALQLLTGSEVASYFLQKLVERFSKLREDPLSNGDGKTCHNILLMLLSLYNLKVVDCLLIYDLIRECLKTFNEQDISLIFLTVKTCGPDIRKDDPSALKDVIVTFRSKCSEVKTDDKSYVNFMLDAIDALKNNNIRKIPLYDPTVVDDGRKSLKAVLQGRSKVSEVQLKVSLKDLLDADEKGRWWITGSAWSGRGPVEEKAPTDNSPNDTDFSATVLKAAKKQRMNTNIRKQIFCVMVSSEDYIDAFEKLLKLNLKEKQAREVIHVLVDCCLQEKSYNPFYAHLANKFCEFNKSNSVTLQYNLWDHFKTISTMKKYSFSNMGHFLAHMIASKSLSLSVLKVVAFGALDKTSIDFFSSFFTIFLSQYPHNSIKFAFNRISNLPKLSLLRQGIKLFLRHFLYPDDDKKDSEIDIRKEKMKECIEIAESALDGCEYIPL